MSLVALQDVVFVTVLIVLAFPLGIYIFSVMDGRTTFASRALRPVEGLIYRAMGIRPSAQMDAKHYARAAAGFSAAGFVVLFVLQIVQGWLTGNPQHLGGVSPALAFNTASSFVTNTNWQAYSGETTMSYLTQALGLTVQNFVSAATGLAVLFALIRGFVRRQDGTVGNFWADLTRGTLYVLLPLSVVAAVLLMSQGVVQSLGSYDVVQTLTGGQQTIPVGPAASQVAIKQLGTNGGGFFGANSAFGLENPTALSNFIECLSLVLVPAATCVAFGRAVGDAKQGRTLLIVMTGLFVVAVVAITASERYLGPSFAGVAGAGSLEGKQQIFGVGGTSLWGAATTAAANGSVNGSVDSFTAFGGMTLMFLMQLGEPVFGGIGSGLYGMLAFVLLTVFIAGLMVGRTPEYLGKKIEPYDMRMVCLIILTPPLLTLLGTAAAVIMPGAAGWTTNSGAHGFSEVLYTFTSMANNNGSAFEGYSTNTLFTNIVGGLIMLAARFMPMIATILLAGNLSGKKSVAAGEGTLSTTNGLFIGLLTGIVLIIGALSFLPCLALGPIADFFTH